MTATTFRLNRKTHAELRDGKKITYNNGARFELISDHGGDLLVLRPLDKAARAFVMFDGLVGIPRDRLSEEAPPAPWSALDPRPTVAESALADAEKRVSLVAAMFASADPRAEVHYAVTERMLAVETYTRDAIAARIESELAR